MNNELILLLKEFGIKKQFLAELLSKYSQYNLLCERHGFCKYLATEFEYLFHGIGCLITYKGEEINFDLLFENGFDGRIDGFSVHDIELFCKSIERTDLYIELIHSLEDLITREILIRSKKQRNILFLKDDYNNPGPFIPEFRWNQEWYLENGI